MGLGVRSILWLMVVLGAFLTFTLEPLTGRLVTPIFGGSIHVWNLCVSIFQGLFLAAMLYAHGVARRFPFVHVALVLSVLLTLPIDLSGELSPTAPVSEVLRSVLIGVGLPFFALATTSVVAQAWWADSKWGESKEPYSLFAGSNLGSLVGLMAYPLVLERWFGVGQQRMLWSFGYVVYAVVVLLAFRRLGSGGANQVPVRIQNLRRWPLWLAFSALPSALSLGLTNVVASELGSFPLFWVIPLGLYLGSFAVAFREHRESDGVQQFWPDLLIYLLFLGQMALLIEMHALLYAAFFCICWASHEVLYQRRPPASQLTEFYVILAAGGWLGGSLVTFVAPRIFVGYSEYTLSLLALGALFLFSQGLPDFDWWRRVHIRLSGSRAILFLSCASLYGAVYLMEGEKGYVERVRNSYGVFSVAERESEDGRRYRELSNSSTSHGKQYLDEDYANLPVSYYHPTGSNGMALALREKPARIAGVGLGAGAIAAYLEPNERLVFYEINPLSEKLARKWFSYLDAAEGEVEVRIGDARLLLEREDDDATYDVIFVDAFAGDGIPTHLLTREAMDSYTGRLREDGLLIFHISNRYYDLRNVLGMAARGRGWAGAVAFGQDILPDDPLADAASTVVMSPDKLRLSPLFRAGWSELDEVEQFQGSHEWTDDFVDILGPFFAMRSAGRQQP